MDDAVAPVGDIHAFALSAVHHALRANITVLFVGLVLAVEMPVAFPIQGDASGVVAQESVLGTSWRRKKGGLAADQNRKESFTRTYLASELGFWLLSLPCVRRKRLDPRNPAKDCTGAGSPAEPEVRKLRGRIRSGASFL